MTTNNPENHPYGVLAPARDLLLVTPSDSADIVQNGAVPRALWIGDDGPVDLAIETIAGTTVTITGVKFGILPIQVKKVLATGTTATNIVAFF